MYKQVKNTTIPKYCINCGKKITTKKSHFCIHCRNYITQEYYNFELRPWQKHSKQKALLKYQHSKVYTQVAGVGAGKTIFGVDLARELIKTNQIKDVIVLTPLGLIKQNWVKTFREIGLFHIREDYDSSNFDYDWKSNKGCKGVVLNYQILGSGKFKKLKQHVNKKTLLILDEGHHVAEGQAWGKAVEALGDKCGRILFLSGTPHRTGESYIPFVKYKLNEEGKLELQTDDYYGYPQAVTDGVVVNTQFHSVAGWADVRMSDDNQTQRIELTGNMEKGETSKSLGNVTTIIPGQNDWTTEVLQQANNQLHQIQSITNHNLAGLVVCKTIKDAEYLGKKARVLFGKEKVKVVTSDQSSKAKKDIDAFRKWDSKANWLISVGMVNEGVDIDRLRVLVYASNKITLTHFHQTFGRIVRNPISFSNYIDQAYMYMPNHGNLLKLAQNVENEVHHIIPEYKRTILLNGTPVQNSKKGSDIPFQVVEASGSGDIETTCYGITIAKDKYDLAEKVSKMTNLPVSKALTFVEKYPEVWKDVVEQI